jgi:hypothetical protein
MADALTSDSGSGEPAAEDNRGSLKSPRERAAHYRHYAAQIRDLAEGEPNGSLRDRLIEIAGEYEELGKDPVDRGAQPKRVSRRRRARSPKRARPVS